MLRVELTNQKYIPHIGPSQVFQSFRLVVCWEGAHNKCALSSTLVEDKVKQSRLTGTAPCVPAGRCLAAIDMARGQQVEMKKTNVHVGEFFPITDHPALKASKQHARSTTFSFGFG